MQDNSTAVKVVICAAHPVGQLRSQEVSTGLIRKPDKKCIKLCVIISLCNDDASIVEVK
jgi:hypothetical protein